MMTTIEELYKRSQPRDKNGRWSPAGGGGGGGDASDTAVTGAAAYDKIIETTPVLSGDQKWATFSYKANGYTAINGGLRKARGDKSAVTDEKARDDITHLDNAFKEVKPSTVTIKTSRGLSDTVSSFGSRDPKDIIGKTVLDHGYTSTTTKDSVTQSFMKNETSDTSRQPAYVNVTIPKGTKAMAVSHATGQWKSEKQHPEAAEYEILLPRGSKFNVTDAKVKDGVMHIDMEVV